MSDPLVDSGAKKIVDDIVAKRRGVTDRPWWKNEDGTDVEDPLSAAPDRVDHLSNKVFEPKK